MSKHWVEEVLQRYNLLKTFSEQAALELWSDIAGERIAKLTRAARFSNGVLYIAVVSSTVAQELSFLKPRYIDALNGRLEEAHVKEIRFIPGHFRTVSTAGFVKSSSNSDREAAQRLFLHIEDPVLRASFERLYLTLREREERLLSEGGKRCPSCGIVFRDVGDRCPGCRFDGVEEKQVTD
jgi:hypothetical protein